MGKPNKNQYKIQTDVCTIYTAKGDMIFVDNIDFYKYHLKDYSWSVSSRGYAVASKHGKKIYMHRLLMSPGELQVDHIDHNKLNNMRNNLRVVTNQENHHNKLPNKRNKSGYSGVWWDKDCHKWCAQLRLNDKCVSSTLHITLEEAVAKRKELERIYWGL